MPTSVRDLPPRPCCSGVKVSAPFSEDMLEQSTRFYLDHYIAVFGEKVGLRSLCCRIMSCFGRGVPPPSPSCSASERPRKLSSFPCWPPCRTCAMRWPAYPPACSGMTTVSWRRGVLTGAAAPAACQPSSAATPPHSPCPPPCRLLGRLWVVR